MSNNNEDNFKQATWAALGCISWIAVAVAFVGLIALVKGVFF